ncbi:hypothetical protein BDR26DRAFT_798759 [Obelidium mucronatum]|nr:hypothetical protein BDR26DRAFT_798759 [Obelidium mucronatum]
MFQTPTTALLRQLSPSFAQCVTSVDLESAGPIDLAKAQLQHQLYQLAVTASVASTVEVEADAAHPDCCFVEDTLVVCGDTAVANCLGHETRRGEVGPVKKALEKVGLEFRELNTFCPMAEVEGAHVDGGDVLTLEKHQFVGLSKRTNTKGVEFLKKCLVSGLTPTTIVVADNASGKAVFDEMQQLSGNILSPIYVPDEVAANVLSFPWAKPQPTVMIQANHPKSEAILRKNIPVDWKIVPLDMSELIKADGALTCCSVLV